MRPTALTRLLGVEHPLIQAPMGGGPTTPELVAAVSGAGAFGVLAGTGLPPEALDAGSRAVQAATSAPFGVNFLIVEPGSGGDVEAVQSAIDPLRAELGLPPGPREIEVAEVPVDEQVEVCLRAGVPVLTFAMGDPSRFAGCGALVGAMATTVDDAVRLADAGADFVVAQGAEAGGHRSTFDASERAARRHARARAAGRRRRRGAGGRRRRNRRRARRWPLRSRSAQAAAQLGTRFLLAREAATAPGYREALLRAVETDTVMTTAFTGRAARSIRNRLTDERPDPLPWPLQRAALADLYGAALQRGESELHPLLAGQNLRGLRDGAPGGGDRRRGRRRGRARARRALEFGHAADSRPARARRAPRRLHLRNDRRPRGDDRGLAGLPRRRRARRTDRPADDVVFWLAHVYAHALAQSVSRPRISQADVLSIAHRESSIIEAAVLPVVLLVLGSSEPSA